MKKMMAYTFLTIWGVLIIGACGSSEETTTTSSTSLPDYATTTLSGTVAGTSWTFNTGRVTVPSSSSGSYWVYMTNDNLSNACSSTYSGSSSNPLVMYARSDAPAAGETELGLSTGTVTFYDGTTNYIITTGKIKIDSTSTTAVTGKMYAKYGSTSEINGTFTLSRCCLSGSSYALCTE